MISQIAFQSSIKFTKKIHFFYKGVECLYCPSDDNSQTDVLICKHSDSFEKTYKLLQEFCSALSFGWDVKVSLKGYVTSISSYDGDLSSMGAGCIDHREIRIESFSDEIHRMALVQTKEQSDLVRLYRVARFSNIPQLSFLYYWHILCYPEDNEDLAIPYIDDAIEKNEQYKFKSIEDKQLLLKNKLIHFTYGHYFKKAIKNSISHFIRNPTFDECSFDLDNIEQIEHLHECISVVKGLARLKMEKDCQIKIGYGPTIIQRI